MIKTSRAIRLAGGRQFDLAEVFGITVQAVSLWAKRGRLPRAREFELRQRRPQWFNGVHMAGKVKQHPKPKRPPNNLAEARARQGRPNKRTGGGPPFRAKASGTSDTSV